MKGSECKVGLFLCLAPSVGRTTREAEVLSEMLSQLPLRVLMNMLIAVKCMLCSVKSDAQINLVRM